MTPRLRRKNFKISAAIYQKIPNSCLLFHVSQWHLQISWIPPAAPVHHQRPAQQEVVAVMLQKIAAHTIVIVMAMTNAITHLKRNQQITKKQSIMTLKGNLQMNAIF